MSNVFFISDLHLFHKNVCKFRPQFTSVQQHNNVILANIMLCAGKRNKLIIAGDTFLVNTSEEKAEAIQINSMLNSAFSEVVYVLGNHCTDKPIRQELVQSLPNIQHGLLKYKEFWISHAPIHPLQLRGRVNVHGHVHSETVDDPNYFNICCENIGYKPVELKELRNQMSARISL